MDIFDTNYYRKKERNIQTPKSWKEFKREVIYIGSLGIMAQIIFWTFIFPNWHLFFK